MLVCLAQASQAQEVVRNEDGRMIVVYPDGTWHYFDEENDDPKLQEKKGLFSPTDERLLENRMQYQEAEKQENLLALELVRVRLDMVALSQELEELHRNPGSLPAQNLILLESRLKSAGELHEKLVGDYRRAKSKTQLLGQLLHTPPELYDRKIKEWEKETNPPIEATANSKNKGNTTASKNHKQYDPASDVMLRPPALPCQASYFGKDPSGNMRRELMPETIFTRTDKSLLTQFQQGDFITGKGYLTRISGGLQLFTLEVHIATEKAPQIFGHFKQHDLLELVLLDRNIVRLFNSNDDPGQWHPVARAFVYRGIYIIGAKDEKQLRNGELDSVRVRWSLVQEDFPVYELDFFKRQFDCLEGL